MVLFAYMKSTRNKQKPRLTMRAGGLGGTRREKTAVAAKAFFRFVGWSTHQAANASRWALDELIGKVIF
jgi:hypothetical protein